jgi:uncharacterized OB-fold protein
MDVNKCVRPKAWRCNSYGDVQLLATYEPSEDRYIFPPLPDHLQTKDAELRLLPNVGRLYSYTVNPPNAKRGSPQRAFSLVDFPEQNVRVFGRLRLEGDFRPNLDTPVRVALEESEKGEDYIFDCVEEDA